MQNDASTTRRGFLKTITVGACGYAVGSRLIGSESAYAQTIDENLNRIPMETRWAVASGAFVFTQINANKGLLDKVGQEKYNEIMKKSGLAVGARNKKRAEDFGFPGNDARSVAAMATALVTMYYGPKEKFELVDATADKASVKCTNCAYWDSVQSLKITDDTCSAWSQSWWEGFVTAMNPKLGLKLVKARPWGDSFCEWDIALKV